MMIKIHFVFKSIIHAVYMCLCAGLWRLWTIVQQGHYKLRVSFIYPNGTQNLHSTSHSKLGVQERSINFKPTYTLAMQVREYCICI